MAKGWKLEPGRHALAAKGVPTGRKRNYILDTTDVGKPHIRHTNVMKYYGWKKQKPDLLYGKLHWKNIYGERVLVSKIYGGGYSVNITNKGSIDFPTEHEAITYAFKYMNGKVII